MTRRVRTRYFWSSWPPSSQQRFFRLVLVGGLLLTLSVVIGIRLLAGAVDTEIAQAKAQYGRVLPLVQEVTALQAQKGNLAHLGVEDALWAIVDDLGIEPQLTSLHSTQVDENTPGIQATFTGLSLAKMADFLNALRARASLQTPQCVLTRNPGDPRLADLHLVLAR
ncbi:MAG: hypothetical protein V3571_03260 [Pseudodesulfovibrio sp.]